MTEVQQAVSFCAFLSSNVIDLNFLGEMHSNGDLNRVWTP